MKRKNVLFIIWMFLLIIIIGKNLYAGHRNKDREECGFLSFARKCLSCMMREQTFKNEDEEVLFEQVSFSFTNDSFTKSKIEEVPIEIFHIMCMNLSPLDIVYLSTTSKDIKIKIDEKFWESYIIAHQQEKWDQFITAIRVAFAYSFFEQGNIAKAARFGLPKAKEILKKKQTKINKKKEYINFPYVLYRYPYFN